MFTTRKLDDASPHYLNCFDIDELADYITGDIEADLRKNIFNHLNREKCGYCRKLYRQAEEIVKNRQTEPAATESVADDDFAIDPEQLRLLIRQHQATRPKTPPVPAALETGQIWTTRQQVFAETGELIDQVGYAYPVLIVDSGVDGSLISDNIIRAAPISVDTEFIHPGHSLALDREHLGYSAIIEAFNEKPMLAGNLKEYCGKLSLAELDEYFTTRNRFMAGSYPEPDAEILRWEEKELQFTEYLAAPVNEAIWEGDEVLFMDSTDDIDKAEETDSEGSRPDNVISFPSAAHPDSSVAETENVSPLIELVQYQLAAADSELILPELSPNILYSSPDIKIAIIQRRNVVVCRIMVDYDKTGSERPALMIDKQPRELTEKYPGVYDADLGESGRMPEKIDLECRFGEWTLSFSPRFRTVAYSDNKDNRKD